jgi:hypothetical protein
MTDTMLDKVRKLLAKAEDPGCTPAEAAALNDKAAELIAKYGVDQALLAAATPEADPVGDRTISIYAPYALDKASLLGAVAHALRCRSVRIKHRTGSGNGYGMHLFGCASDLERTELLYTSLLVQASYGLAAAKVPPYEPLASFRRSWLAGFAQAVGARLRQAEQRASAEAATGSGPSMELVLADRGDRVARRVAEAYPRLGTAPPRRLIGSGAGDGYAAGQRADLGGVGGRTPLASPASAHAIMWSAEFGPAAGTDAAGPGAVVRRYATSTPPRTRLRRPSRAAVRWPTAALDNPRGWLITVACGAWRALRADQGPQRRGTGRNRSLRRPQRCPRTRLRSCYSCATHRVASRDPAP